MYVKGAQRNSQRQLYLIILIDPLLSIFYLEHLWELCVIM